MEAVQNILETLQGYIALYGIQVLGAIIIFFVGKYVAGLIRNLIKKLMTKAKVEVMLVGFVSHLVYVALLAFVIIATLGKVGVPVASFVAIVGAAGLAIGFALQGSLGNFASGVLILLFRPFKVGDFIEAGGVTGVVEEIEIFTTTLKSPDNKKIIAPNGGVMGGNIINYTANDTRRIDLVVGVGYGDDLQKTKSVLSDVLGGDDRVLKDPAPTIGVLELGDSSVNFAVRPWVKTAEYWDVFFALNEEIKKRLDAEGISIPFPQRDVHLFNETSA